MVFRLLYSRRSSAWSLGEGFVQAMKILDGGRISLLRLALGIAKGAFERPAIIRKEREQFGQPISRFPGHCI